MHFRNTALAAVCVLLSASSAFADLTRDQKLADFRNLVDTFAKNYAFYEWKRDAIKFDALSIGSWLDRVGRTGNDIEYFEICVEYVRSLKDAHDAYIVPSTFRATLGFGADIYEGKVLIDAIDRNRLPEADFPFQIGDELLAIDGRLANDLIKDFDKYVAAAHESPARRAAAEMLTDRSQSSMPRAHEVPDASNIMVKRQSGETATYTVPWEKTGLPLTSLAPGLPVKTNSANTISSLSGSNFLRNLRNYALPRLPAVTGSAALKPVFAMPEGFILRRGEGVFDPVFSGIIPAGELKIGFIRVPHFLTSSSGFQSEVAFLRENTDGLIVDLMRNPGGNVCTAETMLRSVMPGDFTLLGAEVRVSWSDVIAITEDIELARLLGESPEFIEYLERMLREFDGAFRENRPRTNVIPLCNLTLEGKPAVDRNGNDISYSKPLMVLVDEFSASAAEIFAATVQDNGRGKVFGTRTSGAGGSVISTAAGIYSEGGTSLTITALNRRGQVTTPEFGSSAYVENVGVRPEIVNDYMTVDNLLNRGKAFVEAFTAAMVEHINASR